MPKPKRITSPITESTNRLAKLKARIRADITEYSKAASMDTPNYAIELARPSYDEQELLSVIDVLLEDRLTMGKRVKAFENAWSEYLPSAFSAMVNSGSSANLIALSALAFPDTANNLKPGDEVIVPAVAWSTSIFPIAQVGCVPVLVDIDRETLNLDPVQVTEAITPKTKAIMAVHLLGNPCDMFRIKSIADEHKLWLVEDCCESHGASIDNQRVGTFGDLSTFSFFFSHHITTIEGGMVCGHDSTKWTDLILSLRAHGWIRERSDYENLAKQYPDIDPRWLFLTPGYNLRPTEINAAFGLSQVTKLPRLVKQRQGIRTDLLKRLAKFDDILSFQKELPGHKHSAFALAIIVRPEAPFTREELQSHLEQHQIQTRPIIGSNLARQPALSHIPHRIHGDLENADEVHYRGLMIANHHDITQRQQDHLIDCISNFVSLRISGRNRP